MISAAVPITYYTCLLLGLRALPFLSRMLKINTDLVCQFFYFEERSDSYSVLFIIILEL